jgi:hypothetical protein
MPEQTYRREAAPPPPEVMKTGVKIFDASLQLNETSAQGSQQFTNANAETRMFNRFNLRID